MSRIRIRRRDRCVLFSAFQILLLLPQPYDFRRSDNLLLVEATTSIASDQIDNLDGLDGKELPDKGDGECLSLSDRYDNFFNGEDASSWLRPCELDDEEEEEIDLPDNGILLELFASLPAYGPNLGTILSWIIVGYLDEAAWEYDIQSFSGRNESEKPFKVQAVLEHQKTIPEKIYSNATTWWWKYDFIFYCKWGDRNQDNFNRYNEPVGSPIVDDYTLDKIHLDLRKHLAYGLESMKVFGFREATNGLIAMSQEDPRYSTTPFIDRPITEPPTIAPTSLETLSPTTNPTAPDDNKSIDGDGSLDDTTYQIPIDPQYWDWRRYIGLVVFLTTCCGTCILTWLAGLRKERRSRKELWGNLGTEEGVDALLETTWKFRGDKMEVYNKAGYGYRDDDSMLIGGFEQKEFFDADITVTQPDSESSPEPGSSGS